MKPRKELWFFTEALDEVRDSLTYHRKQFMLTILNQKRSGAPSTALSDFGYEHRVLRRAVEDAAAQLYWQTFKQVSPEETCLNKKRLRSSSGTNSARKKARLLNVESCNYSKYL
jgi:hypothetical protein